MMNSVINLKWHTRNHHYDGKISIVANTIKIRHVEKGSIFLSGETNLQPHIFLVIITMINQVERKLEK